MFGSLDVPLHVLDYVFTPKYYSPSWLAQLALGGGVSKKSHKEREVHHGYMLALDKLVLDEECAQVRSELIKYISVHGVFGNLHTTKDLYGLSPIKW